MTEHDAQNLILLKLKEKKFFRRELVQVTGLTDRKIRDIIADLQSQGSPIVSLGKGYWMGTDEEVKSYRNREMNRAFTILRKLKNLVPQAGEALKQLEIGFSNNL